MSKDEHTPPLLEARAYTRDELANRPRGNGKPWTYAEGILSVLNYRARNPVRLVTQDGQP